MLWERGWINEGNIHQYTVDGQKDGFGVFQPHTSLKYLMGNCKDFGEEESLLQLTGRKMGILVDWTPNVTVSLQKKELNILGVVRRISIVIYLYREKNRKKVSRLLLESA